VPKFDIEVTRTGIGFATIRVEAQSRQEAEFKALDEAGNHLFSEKVGEYELTNGKAIDQSEKIEAPVSAWQPDLFGRPRPHENPNWHEPEAVSRWRHPMARTIIANLAWRYRQARQMVSRAEAAGWPDAKILDLKGAEIEAWNAFAASTGILRGSSEWYQVHDSINSSIDLKEADTRQDIRCMRESVEHLMASFVDLLNGRPQAQLHEQPIQTIERAMLALDGTGGMNFTSGPILDLWRSERLKNAHADDSVDGGFEGPRQQVHALKGGDLDQAILGLATPDEFQERDRPRGG
jgi:hypothetical protein